MCLCATVTDIGTDVEEKEDIAAPTTIILVVAGHSLPHHHHHHQLTLQQKRQPCVVLEASHIQDWVCLFKWSPAPSRQHKQWALRLRGRVALPWSGGHSPAQPWWARHSSGTTGQLRPPYSRASVRARPTLPIHFGQEPPIYPFQGKNTVLLPTPTVQWSGAQLKIELFLDLSLCLWANHYWYLLEMWFAKKMHKIARNIVLGLMI